jgi:hypothetical protein
MLRRIKLASDERLESALEQVTTEYVEDLGLTPHDITHGHCYEWARKVVNLLPGSVFKDVDLWPHRGKADLPYHVWVEYKRKAYDAETLGGVSTWQQLPFFKSHINQNILPKLKSRTMPRGPA